MLDGSEDEDPELVTFYDDRHEKKQDDVDHQDWAAAEKREVPIGQGIVDWRKLFAAAKKGGIRNYFVELPMEMLQPSYQYLHNLKV